MEKNAKTQRRGEDDGEETIDWPAESSRLAGERKKKLHRSALASFAPLRLCVDSGPIGGRRRSTGKKRRRRGTGVTAAGNRFWRQIEDSKVGLLIKPSPGFSAGLTQPCKPPSPPVIAPSRSCRRRLEHPAEVAQTALLLDRRLPTCGAPLVAGGRLWSRRARRHRAHADWQSTGSRLAVGETAGSAACATAPTTSGCTGARPGAQLSIGIVRWRPYSVARMTADPSNR